VKSRKNDKELHDFMTEVALVSTYYLNNLWRDTFFYRMNSAGIGVFATLTQSSCLQ
jgi:hypothetical protein